jgi:hypothetical protein
MAAPKPVPASSSQNVNHFYAIKKPPSGGFFIIMTKSNLWGQLAAMKRIGIIAATLAVLALPAKAELSCNAHPGFSAVDMSQPSSAIQGGTGETGPRALKSIGIKTVIRYYVWPEREISCKALLPAESDTILAAGMNIVTVFQHETDDPETFFDRGRGAIDAKHAIAMAGANGQPEGSAIYFAVDGVDQTIRDLVFEHGMSNGRTMSNKRKNHLLRADRVFGKHIRRYARFLKYHNNIFHKPVPLIRASDMHPAITRYFDQVNAVFTLNGKFKIGAYASGAVCELLLDKHLVDYCWLAQSTGWPGYNHFYASRKWSMVQEKSTFCKVWRFRGEEKVRFDFNKVNPAKKNYGQWSKKGEITPLSILPEACTLKW